MRKNDPDSNNMPNVVRIGPDGLTYEHSLTKGRDPKIGTWFGIPRNKYPEWVNTPEKREKWNAYWDQQLNWWTSEIDQCKRNDNWDLLNGRNG